MAYVNPQYTNIYNFPSGQSPLGWDMTELIGSPSAAASVLSDFYDSGGDQKVVLLRPRMDGHLMTLRVEYTTLHDGQRIIGHYGVEEDITARMVRQPEPDFHSVHGAKLPAVELYYARTPGRDRIHQMLHAAGVMHTPDEQAEWDLFLPSRGKTYLSDLRDVLPSRTDQWIGALPEYYRISNKLNLWHELFRRGPEAAALMPESWVLTQRTDLARLRSSWQPGQQILLKNPYLQQRKGLMFCDDPSAIPDAVEQGFRLGQRLADDLVLIGGRRFHLRIYVLVVRQDGCFSFYVHRDGRVIYAPHPAALGGPASWLTRSVGSDVLPAGLPFLLTELELSLQVVDELIAQVARVLLPGLEQAWSFGSNPAMQLFGTDVLLREGGKAYLVEFNMGPDMSARCPVDRAMKNRVIADQLACVGLDCGGSWPGGFRSVFSSR